MIFMRLRTKRSARRVIVLSALILGVALSQALRTLAAICADGVAASFRLSARDLGLFASIFPLACGFLQIPVGIALDRYDAIRVVAVFLVIAVVGTVLSGLAPTFSVLLAGQALIGVGCAPALMGAFAFVGREYPVGEFAAMSGRVIALGSLGMLATGTPLAWVASHWTWRAPFLMIAATSGILLLCIVVAGFPGRLDCEPRRRPHTSVADMTRQLKSMLTRHTVGLLTFGAIAYAIPITVRGLWLVPIFTSRYGLDLVHAGHVALAVSLAMVGGPIVFGWVGSGSSRCRRVMFASAIVSGMLLFSLALAPRSHPELGAGIAIVFGFASSFYVLNYADVRLAYNDELAGRALTTLNTTVFLGVAAVQWSSGFVAEAAVHRHRDAQFAVLVFEGALLMVGACAFALLPQVPGRRLHGTPPRTPVESPGEFESKKQSDAPTRAN